MATVPTETMRETLFQYYKKRGWNPMKLATMPDNQVIAVYFRYQGQGFPTPAPAKKKTPAKKPLPMLSKDTHIEQMRMF